MSLASFAAGVADSVRSAFNFTVDKFPLHGPDGMSTPFYGLFRSDDGSVVGPAVGRGYVPHDVDDVAALAEAAVIALGDFGEQAQVTCHFSSSGHNVIVRPSDAYRRSIFGTGDNIFPRFMIDAGYGRAFRAQIGFYRDACRNLAMLRHVGGTSVAIRHTVGMRSQLDELVATFRDLDGRFDSVFDVAAKLEQRRVDLAEFISTVYPMPENASARTQTIVTNRAERIVRRIIREREIAGRQERSLESATLWEAINAITGYVQHDKPRHGKPGEVERALLGIDDSDSARAWEIAMAMAS